MASTFDTVANIISETCDIEREKITPDSHAIDDLGIDSLDFLDIAFAIDKAFGIKLPLEQWTQEVNDGKATTEQYFVLKNLCARIDELIAAKGARPGGTARRHEHRHCRASSNTSRRLIDRTRPDDVDARPTPDDPLGSHRSDRLDRSSKATFPAIR